MCTCAFKLVIFQLFKLDANNNILIMLITEFIMLIIDFFDICGLLININFINKIKI